MEEKRRKRKRMMTRTSDMVKDQEGEGQTMLVIGSENSKQT